MVQFPLVEKKWILVKLFVVIILLYMKTAKINMQFP